MLNFVLARGDQAGWREEGRVSSDMGTVAPRADHRTSVHGLMQTVVTQLTFGVLLSHNNRNLEDGSGLDLGRHAKSAEVAGSVNVHTIFSAVAITWS
jgi:hypothetical protein